MEGNIEIHGGIGSPYTSKVRAYLRYARTPHTFHGITSETEALLKSVAAPVIPIARFADGRLLNDSTPLIAELDGRAHAERSVYPTEPTLRFLALLLEDFADEWATKWMFHFRWRYTVDQELVSAWLAFDRLRSAGRETLSSAAREFRDRQVGRMPLVGCMPANEPTIEGTFFECIAALDTHVRDFSPFLFGTRPSIADFALYGQLAQLADDPTSAFLMRAKTPHAARWVRWHEDLSGVSGEWMPLPQVLASPAARLVALATRVYLPFLQANERAIASGDKSFTVRIDGRSFSQGAFKYQAKCLSVLRNEFAKLEASSLQALTAAFGDEAFAGLA